MKHLFSTLVISTLLLCQFSVQAQSTPGIASNSSLTLSDLSSELFGSKEKRRMKERNQRIQEKNERLQSQIYELEIRLDDCSDREYQPRYQRSRRQQRSFSWDGIRTDISKRRLEKDYVALRSENQALREHRNWLRQELADCQDANQYERSRDYRDGDRRRGYSDCDCDRPKKQKAYKHKKHKAKKSKGCNGHGRKYRDND